MNEGTRYGRRDYWNYGIFQEIQVKYRGYCEEINSDMKTEGTKKQ